MSASEIGTSTEVLTIDEAAALLRISRNAAYAAQLASGGPPAQDLPPCIEIGRTLRVPAPNSTACSAVRPNQARKY